MLHLIKCLGHGVSSEPQDSKANYKRRTTQKHKNSVCHKIQGVNTSLRGLPKKVMVHREKCIAQ